ncbi:Uncharacterised protein [uncultured archaeon]|nr:Uncharacterised protein [uncultured archaeon]
MGSHCFIVSSRCLPRVSSTAVMLQRVGTNFLLFFLPSVPAAKAFCSCDTGKFLE